jgi:thiol-disulfide isomerase/thioredoxin
MRSFLLIAGVCLAAACAAGPSTAVRSKPAVVDPTPHPAAAADLIQLSIHGEDVPELAPHAVRGKVTLFDFYATWCAPCRTIDAHVLRLLGQRADVAVRKLNVVSWETPLAAHYLRDASGLPLVVVYGKDARPVDSIAGLNLEALDRAIEKGSRP